MHTNCNILAPEILSVFRNSQIFHDNSSKSTSQASNKTPTVHKISSQIDQDKLIERLEGKE